ncbi:MAG: sensor histidine kinase [Desulfovibrio sp.]
MTIEQEKNNVNISRQMMFSSIIVSLAPLIIITLVLHSYYSYVYTEKTEAYLVTLVERNTESIDTYLTEKKGNIHQLGESCPISHLSNQSVLEEKLALLQTTYSQAFNDLGIITSNGDQIAYAGPYMLQKENYANAQWFKDAIQKETYISGVFLGKRRIPHFIITRRIETPEGFWLIRATIDFAGFNNLVRDISIGDTGNAFIIDRSGKFQTERRYGIPHNKNFLKTLAQQEFPNGQAIFAEGKGPEDQEYLYASAPLKDGEWILVFQQEKDDALAQLHQVSFYAIVIVLLSSGLIVFTIMMTNRRVEDRIHVAEDSTEVMQKQMVEAGKLVAIGELAAGIAHEINNPVAIMMENAGWVQDLLKEDNVSNLKHLDEITNSLGEISIQGSRCKDITHKLLSFARKTDSRKREVHINDLLEELISFSSQKARYGNVTVKTDFGENLPPLQVSPTELQQVILNLVNNGIDAMHKDDSILSVKSYYDDEGYIGIDIRDNGDGIAPANLTRIFEPFFTTKPVGKGTGLGLAICYGIIHKMGGDIVVESELGEGTVFSVRIPVEQDTQ